MANKEKTAFVCTECGYDTPKWSGKCPACGRWNTFVEQKINAVLVAHQSFYNYAFLCDLSEESINEFEDLLCKIIKVEIIESYTGHNVDIDYWFE